MEEMISSLETSRILNVTTQTIQNWYETGRLNAAFVTLGGQRKYKKSEVEELLKELKEKELAKREILLKKKKEKKIEDYQIHIRANKEVGAEVAEMKEFISKQLNNDQKIKDSDVLNIAIQELYKQFKASSDLLTKSWLLENYPNFRMSIRCQKSELSNA